jgi:hypothetical protein
MSKPKAQFIDPRTTGRRPLHQPVFDSSALQRADDAMEAMGGSFEQWLDADIRRLQIARSAAEHAAWSDGALAAVYAATHDLKGMGGSYGYPLVTQLAASLCRLIETDAGKAAARENPGLVTAHIHALRAAVRDRIATAEHPVGRALIGALEAEVERLGVAPE